MRDSETPDPLDVLTTVELAGDVDAFHACVTVDRTLNDHQRTNLLAWVARFDQVDTCSVAEAEFIGFVVEGYLR